VPACPTGFCFFNSFIHMCIRCLGHFSLLPIAPSLCSHFQAESFLPLSLILLKRKYMQ
jgi:hypothetical protein